MLGGCLGDKTYTSCALISPIMGKRWFKRRCDHKEWLAPANLKADFVDRRRGCVIDRRAVENDASIVIPHVNAVTSRHRLRPVSFCGRGTGLGHLLVSRMDPNLKVGPAFFDIKNLITHP